MSSPLFTPPAFWEEGDTQPRLSVNDTFLRWWITQTNVDNATTAQPAIPVDGDCYIIQATHTGAQWASFTPKDLAIFFAGTWYAFAPVEGMRVSVSGAIYLFASGSWTIAGGGSGDVTGPGSSNDSSVALFDGTTGKLIKDGGETLATLRSIPQNSKSAAYTLVLTDAGKHILHPGADATARVMTIPANSSVAFPIGSAVTFVNQNGAGVVTIAITTDTMRLAGSGATGSRTLAANGVATAIKITSTEWIVSGVGLT